MSEHRQQSCPTASTPAFDSSGRYIEDTGRFGDRIALHVHQHQCGPLIDGQFRQRSEELAMQILPLCRCLGGLMRLEKLLQALRVVDGEVLREAALRARSRQAFTVMR